MKFALAFGLLIAATTSFAQVSVSADLPVGSQQIKIADARYFEVASRVVTTKLPGCSNNGEQYGMCDNVIVRDVTPVVELNISYDDGSFTGAEGGSVRNLVLTFPVEAFSPADIAALKGSRFSRSWAKAHFDLTVTKEARTLQVVDTRNSRLCNIGEAGEPAPGCVEDIRFKTATTIVKAVKATIK